MASSSWDQSTFDDGVHFVSVAAVVDVLGKGLAMMDQRDYLLNVSDLLGNTGNVWTMEG